MKRIVITAAAVGLLATGCGGKAAQSQASQDGNSATTSASPSKTPSSPKDAALGATMTIEDPEAVITVKATGYRPLKREFPPDRKGYAYGGVNALLRVPQVHGVDSVAVSWMPWSLEFADDTVIEPVSSWSDEWFAVPLYPGFERTVRKGRCVSGWVLFEVPKGKRPIRVAYAPESSDGTAETATWKLH
jgi:hypothetical protein